MTPEQSKTLTEWGGECTHRHYTSLGPNDIAFKCDNCGLKAIGGGSPTWPAFRTFDNPTDVQWLVDALKEKGKDGKFLDFLETYPNDTNMWEWIFGSTPSEQCHLIYQFIEE
jgi:hypothetical protein